jgi:benzoylformate decarboxylase
MGMLYNAFREGTPLLVTAGQQDRRLIFEDPILWGEMVEVTKPWTKWSVEVNRVQDLPVALRRAAQAALTPPTGPVFMSIPLDVQLEMCETLDLTPIRLPDAQVRPPADAIQAVADLLLQAKNPGILSGSRITEQDAMGELVQVAELLGAPVITESGTTHGRLAFPSDHPLNAQGLPLWSPEIREKLKEFDVLLVVGMDLFRQYLYFEPSRAIPEHIQLIHIDEDPYQLGKNYPLAVGVIGHSKASLAELSDLLKEQMTDEQASTVIHRSAQRMSKHAKAHEALQHEIESQLAVRPITPLALMGTLARVLPPNVAVIEEAVTTTNTTFERLGVLKNTTGYFGHRGWALGWGLGCAIGAKLAWPNRPVLALLGEGATTYGVQGLWTAARYSIPVTFVICNNAQYQILKICARGLQLPQAVNGKGEGLDVVNPEVDHVALARAFGVEAHRVTDLQELSDRVRDSFQRDRPILFDVPISREIQGRLNYG